MTYYLPTVWYPYYYPAYYYYYPTYYYGYAPYCAYPYAHPSIPHYDYHGADMHQATPHYDFHY